MAVSSNLGFILGPAIAGVLGATAAGERLPVLAAFLISIIATAIILYALPDPEPCVLSADPEPPSVRDVLGGDQKQCYRMRGASQLSSRQVLALPGVALLLTLQFLVFLAFNFYYVAFPVHAATTLAWSLPEVGAYFTVMGLLMATVQGPVLSRLARRFGDRPLVITGSLLLAVSFVFLASERTAVIYAGTGFLAAGNGLMWPSLLAALSRATDRNTQGAVQGFAGSANAVASIAGLLVGGLLYTVLEARVFLLSAAVTVMVFVLALRIERMRISRP